MDWDDSVGGIKDRFMDSFIVRRKAETQYFPDNMEGYVQGIFIHDQFNKFRWYVDSNMTMIYSDKT